MRNTLLKIVIIICIIFISFISLKNMNEVNARITNQDIVLDLIAHHDRYHNIYMKQFEGIHTKEETLKIITEVYLNNSRKVLKPQIQLLGNIINNSEDINSIDEFNKFENFKFSYNDDADLLIIEGTEVLENKSDE